MDNVHQNYNAAAAPVVAASGITLVDSIAAARRMDKPIKLLPKPLG